MMDRLVGTGLTSMKHHSGINNLRLTANRLGLTEEHGSNPNQGKVSGCVSPFFLAPGAWESP
jgi:hypothetical protein